MGGSLELPIPSLRLLPSKFLPLIMKVLIFPDNV